MVIDTSCKPGRARPSSRSWILMVLAFVLGFGLIVAERLNAQGMRTGVSIQQDRFLLNGVVTHPGTAAEGLLLNSRMIQAIFDDENPTTAVHWRYPDTGVWDPERNVTEFIAALPVYAEKGLRAVTVGLQGGWPGTIPFGDNQPPIVTAFNSDGSIKPAWLDRLDRVIRAADQHGIVVIVGLFYFGQDHRLANETAVIAATDAVTAWLDANAYTNILVEINNEADVAYDHAILRPARVSELITRVRQRSGGRLKVSTSLGGGKIPTADMVSASDYVLLHGNGRNASGVASMVDQVRAMTAWQAAPKPIVFNEDSTSIANLDSAVSKRASWGYYDQNFQSPAVNWNINTAAKQAFFDRVATLAGTATTTPPPSSGTEAVVSLSLINADTNQPISGFETLSSGSVVFDLATLPTRNLNLRANTSPSIVGSVRFGLNDNPAYRIENTAPYALAGDTPVGDYQPWTLTPGAYVLVATPYTSSNAGGTAGAPLSLSFTITDATAPKPPANVRILTCCD